MAGRRVTKLDEGATPVKKDSKWLVLTNAAWGQSTYERNPAFYGQQYAGIKYRFTYFEISIGLGRGSTDGNGDSIPDSK